MWKMEVSDGDSPWIENVPDELNRDGAPDIELMDPKARALATVEWFNETRREFEDVRVVKRVFEEGPCA